MREMIAPFLFRFTHLSMVVLTLANLLWISGLSCCCASSKCCSSGKSSCCAARSNDRGCSCCCKRDKQDQADGSTGTSGCPRCASNADSALPAQCKLETQSAQQQPCGASGSCDCGQASPRSTAPVARSFPSVKQQSEQPVIALIEPRAPEVRPAESFERHNHLLAALDRPVSIRFGVWRN